MNNDQMFFLTYMWILMALSGIFFYTSVIRIKQLIQSRRRKKMYPYLESAHERLLCKGTHSWDKTKLAMPPLPVGSYTVCRDCGFISGSEDYKLNKPALEVYNNQLDLNKKSRDFLREINKKKDHLTNLLVEKYATNYSTGFRSDNESNYILIKEMTKHLLVDLDVIYEELNKDLDAGKRDG